MTIVTLSNPLCSSMIGKNKETPLIRITLLLAGLLGLLPLAQAQVDEGQTGLWSMYFWNTQFGEGPWGLQGDIQYRQFDVGSDLEQLLIRQGLTYRPKSRPNLLLTLGYGNITSGEFGPSDRDSNEHRVYQEALISQRFSDRWYVRHRFRLEQRWVSGQDFRSRLRYAIFADVPLNGDNLKEGAIYASFYNEIFINGERDIGGGRKVSLFDRNRTYAALGYSLRDKLRLQFGYMHQETDNLGKGQLQLSLHHSF